jgi:hypothetical protein
MSASARRQPRIGDARQGSSVRRNGHPLARVRTDPAGNGAVCTYQYEPEPCRFRVKHDRRKHLIRISGPDGEMSEFEDKPVRFLVVETDPKTGEPRPCFAGGKPKVMLLCREASGQWGAGRAQSDKRKVQSECGS